MNGIIGNFKGIPIALCKCGCSPRIIETYDTFQIMCDACGFAGAKYSRDYFSEEFMLLTYAEQAIKEWNEIMKE